MWKPNPTSNTHIAFSLIIAAAMVAAASAQSAAPSPAPDCFPYLLNMSDCLTFVQRDSNLKEPDPGCCPELSNMVETQPVCFCQLLGSSGQIEIALDVKRALKLPDACNLTTPTPSLSECAASGYPVSSSRTPSEAPSPGAGAGAGAGEAEATSPPSPTVEDDVGSSASNHHFLLLGLPPLFFTLFC